MMPTRLAQTTSLGNAHRQLVADVRCYYADLGLDITTMPYEHVMRTLISHMPWQLQRDCLATRDIKTVERFVLYLTDYCQFRFVEPTSN